MSREQTVRDVAYAIWEAEGKPRGRDAEHWQQAEERVAASLAGGKKTDAKAKTTDAKAKPLAKGGPVASAKDAPAAKPPAKAAATKAAPKTKS
ncbi:MAG: hypothetical protein DCF30_03410 [Hyphomicrobiales bacterium]|nr:MAG: hypothetical protein DCF30_03410 [Hyphomicrobiales bacterium]